MCALGKHLHVFLVVGGYLRALEYLQAHGAVLVVGEEGPAAGLAHILHYAADAHGAVQLAAQVVGIDSLPLGTAAQAALHEVGHLLYLLVGGSFVQLLEVSKGLLLQGDQHAGDNLLPLHRLRLQTIGHHIVYVLDENHVGVYLVEVLYECSVTAGAEEQRAVGLTEGGVVGIGSHRVGAGLLLGEGDVVADAVFLGKGVGLLGHFLLEETDVLVAHSEVHVGLALAGCIECALHEVLLHGRAWPLSILVEEQHAFGQLTVVQPLGLQHVGGHGLIFPGGQQLLDASTLVAAADLVEGIVEGEMRYLVEVFLLKVGGRHVVWGVDKGKHVLEHAAGGSRGGHKFHDAVSVGFVGFPRSHIVAALLGGGGHDAVAHGGCSLQTKEGESGLKLMQLVFELFLADATLGNLF